jgi:hypothetical protein
LSDETGLTTLIDGAHFVIHSKDAEAAFHPAGDSLHEFYLTCDNLPAEIALLASKGFACSEIQEARWGSMTKLRLPGGGEIGLYQPKHPTAFGLTSK